MERTPERGLNISFIDGSSLKVSFPIQTEDRYKRKLMLDEFAEHRVLVIEADGGIHIIPFENIKYMSVYPAPESTSGAVVKGAHVSE